MDRNVLKWLGHIEGREDERMLKKVLNARGNEGRARLKSRLRWKDEVRRVLQDKGIDVRQEKECSRERNE